MKARPPEGVVEAFGGSGALESLDGGEGRCWRAGGVILKPCDTEDAWGWLATHLPTVQATGFRCPLPISAPDGRWVVEGWCAQEAVDGVHARDRWPEVLETVQRFHAATSHLPKPPFVATQSGPWSIGDRVAWGEREVSCPPTPLKMLLDLRRPIDASDQFVHGDVTENVLFSDHAPPAVIDVSPYWRPVGYAYGIVVADAVCWCGADPDSLLEGVSHVDAFPQHLVRGLIFRMVTTIELAKGVPNLSGYEPGLDLVKRLLM